MSTLTERFLQNVQRLGINAQSRPLLAFSGGLDSTVLFHLLKGADIPFAVAHVNYGLRGENSDADEQFCSGLAQQNNIPFFAYDAKPEMAERPARSSLQEVAREIRYRFFATLCEGEGFTHILTAHHANDSVETFFVNLLRGSGLRGLRGIPERNGRIMRPLLPFTRAELETFANENRNAYREDASNQKDGYLRNRIRHHVLPALEQADETALERISGSLENLSREAELLENLLAARFPADIHHTEKQIFLSFPIPLRATVVFKRFQSVGLSYSQAEDLALALESIPGKQFYTPTHRLLVDREAILVEEISADEVRETLWVDEHGFIPGYRLSILPVAEVELTKDPSAAFLDADTLTFPLAWRPIQTGDAMVSLGMKGRKKISDILTDAKVDRFAKQHRHVLCCGDEIVWLEGFRINDSSKITPHTCRVLCIIPEKL